MTIRPTQPGDLVSTKPSSSISSGGGNNQEQRHAARSGSPEQERIEQMRKQAQDVEVELSKRYERMREQYRDRMDVESANQEAAIENQRSKGYAALRDLKRAQDIELGRLKAEGEKRLQEVKRSYHEAINETHRTGTKDLKQLQREQSQSLAHEQKTGEAALEDQKNRDTRRLQTLEEDRDLKYEQASRTYRKEYERMRASNAEANHKSEVNYSERHKSLLQSQDETLNKLNTQAAEALQRIRQDYQAKLSTYESRQEDPFYRIMELGSELEDTGEAFVLRLPVPEYEQENIKVGFRGNQTLVVSGFRRNEEKLEREDGRTQRSAAYQSYSETLPLPAAVDPKLMSRQYEDGELIVHVPKLGPYASKKIYQAPTPERSRAERPDFPKNLNVANSLNAPKKPGGDRPLG